ncbi:Flp family type IVb pilin [Stutzerimonas degradans]|uniref:Flp family type IVb pilin n=1 Tax=Stutzerimonas degradans TaxID=2968968 RepID=UPI0012D890AB|nr:Flp family type IVb pilin [Stutzerimonas degradans]MTZ14654.1 Flp family type IVb pilin [Stutzerimonas degradans]NHC10410.1 Flp family type IVb pilin [Stutzerimonas degradans]
MTIQTIKRAVLKFAKDEDGLTIVEYAVAGGLITAAVVLGFTNLGAAVLARINQLIAALNGTPAA